MGVWLVCFGGSDILFGMLCVNGCILFLDEECVMVVGMIGYLQCIINFWQDMCVLYCDVVFGVELMEQFGLVVFVFGWDQCVLFVNVQVEVLLCVLICLWLEYG